MKRKIYFFPCLGFVCGRGRLLFLLRWVARWLRRSRNKDKKKPSALLLAHIGRENEEWEKGPAIGARARVNAERGWNVH